MSKRMWDFVCRNAPEIKMDDPHLVRCAKYWYYWNLKAEKMAEWTYRIEDFEEKRFEMERRLGIELTAYPNISKKTNTRGELKQFTWNDLREVLTKKDFKNIRKLAVRYGYTVDM